MCKHQEAREPIGHSEAPAVVCTAGCAQEGDGTRAGESRQEASSYQEYSFSQHL